MKLSILAVLFFAAPVAAVIFGSEMLNLHGWGLDLWGVLAVGLSWLGIVTTLERS
jgi:H+/Cl- antiporter ClcA